MTEPRRLGYIYDTHGAETAPLSMQNAESENTASSSPTTLRVIR